MPYSVDYEHRVARHTIDDAHRTILAWLAEQKATVKASRPPTHIEATHGRALQPMGWRKDARKTLAFELQPAGPDVLVRVRVIPPMLNVTDVQIRFDEARANWNELLAELWFRFGEMGAVAEAVHRPPGDWNRSLQQGRSLVTAGIVLIALGVATFGAILYLLPTFIIAPTGLLVAGALALLHGVMTVRSAKSRLARQPGR